MSDNGSLPASPVPLCPGEHFRGHGPADGLTKREAFAMAAMQGIRANAGWIDHAAFDSAAVASQAVCDADALLAELAKERDHA
ncbi:MAG: hypothetical protein GX856_07190 [Gammaproteobacteria bacterium]|nr:hypothetical protein [Gammaproteobacteria bacterium]